MILGNPSEIPSPSRGIYRLGVDRVPRGIKNPLCVKLASRFERIHETCGISLSAVSTASGLSKNVAAGIASGSNIPALDTLERMAAFFGVSAGWLAYGYEGMEPFKERYPRPFVEPPDPIPDPALRVFRNASAGFPARIKASRERSGLSMRALSEAAGVSVQAWSNAEAGKVSPRVDTCERMAVALGVAPRWLAFGEGIAN